MPAGLTQDSASHDAWFRAKVHEALADTAPALPHDQVMQETRARIAAKRGG